MIVCSHSLDGGRQIALVDKDAQIAPDAEILALCGKQYGAQIAGFIQRDRGLEKFTPGLWSKGIAFVGPGEGEPPDTVLDRELLRSFGSFQLLSNE